MRAASVVLATEKPTICTSSAGGGYSSKARPNDEKRRPVASNTSSARTMRRRLPGSMRAAASASTDRSRAYASATPAGVSVATMSCCSYREVLPGDLERVDDRAHVQPGATDEQRPLPARLDVGDRRARERLRPDDRPLLRRIGDVDQMMFHGISLGDRRFGGADVHPSIHLHRVERDDLGIAQPRVRDPARRRTSRWRSDRRGRGAASRRRHRYRNARAGGAGRAHAPHAVRPGASAEPQP